MPKDVVKYELGGVPLDGPGILVAQEGTEHALPARRGENRAVPGQTGRLYITKDPDERRFSLRIIVTGRRADGTLDGAELQANLDRLRQLVAAEGQQLLRLYMVDGSIREGYVEVVSATELEALGPWAYQCVVEFTMQDPWFYDPSTQSVSSSISSLPHSFLVNNPGTVRAENLVITLQGTMTNPKITNTNSGVWVQYQGNLSGTLVLDVRAFTATHNGSDVTRDVVHYGDAYWLHLEPGDNTVQVDADGFSGTPTVQIDFQPPYA